MAGRRKKKITKYNRVLLLLFTLALIITVIILLMAYSDNEVFRNETQFKKYVEYVRVSDDVYEFVTSDHLEYDYGKPVSHAVDYSKCSNPKVNIFRDNRIQEIITSYDAGVSSADERVRALLISSTVHEATNGTDTLLLLEQSSIENDGFMDKGHSYIYTYHFSRKTGDVLVPQQVFYEGYKYYCYEYFSEFFIKNYGDKLLDGWQEYIKPSSENYLNYTVTDKGVMFFFDEGTILDETEGVVYAGITGSQAETILRDKILQRYIDPEKPMVALTYDDGPGGEAEDRILDCLEQNNAVATFFYQGVFIEGREEKIKRALDLECEIGNHTWNHPVLTSLKSKDVQKQFDKTNDAIYDACGAYPTVFRPSYGETDSKINKMSNMPVIMWSVDTLDWESRNGKKVFTRVKKSGNLDGDIILLHSIHSSTADATEMLVPWLKENGYQLVTVSELIKYKTGADPMAGKVYRTYK